MTTSAIRKKQSFHRAHSYRINHFIVTAQSICMLSYAYQSQNAATAQTHCNILFTNTAICGFVGFCFAIWTQHYFCSGGFGIKSYHAQLGLMQSPSWAFPSCRTLNAPSNRYAHISSLRSLVHLRPLTAHSLKHVANSLSTIVFGAGKIRQVFSLLSLNHQLVAWKRD